MSQSSAAGGSLGKLFSWVRATVTGLFGLCSGAAIMYLTPLVDQVVKPARPFPNFAYHAEGNRVTFEDRSEGRDGFWDFGDGSALEPYAPGQKSLTHVYARPGEYAVKLVLRNLLGEEAERAVSVHVGGPAEASGPAVESFDVQPVDPNRYAPATFRVTARVRGADLCVWACGHDHPLEVVQGASGVQDRHVTFQRPGNYTIKLAAVRNKELVEETRTVQVNPPAPDVVMAVVKVKSQAYQVQTAERQVNEKVTIPADFKGEAYAFAQELPAQPGTRLTAARLADTPGTPHVRNPKIEVAADGSKAILSGELLPGQVPPAGQGGVPASWVAQLVLTQEKLGTPVTLAGDPVVMHLQVPTSTAVPLPATPEGWVVQGRQVELELYDGARKVWSGPQLPKQSPVLMQYRPWQVSAAEDTAQLRIDVLPDRQGLWVLGSQGFVSHLDAGWDAPATASPLAAGPLAVSRPAFGSLTGVPTGLGGGR